MQHPVKLASVGCVSAILILATGCADRVPDKRQATPAADSALKSDVTKALAELPVEDRDQATSQEICPVSGEGLGSMGMPLKIVVDGNSFFVCCPGCEKEAKENFDKYFAKAAGRSSRP